VRDEAAPREGVCLEKVSAKKMWLKKEHVKERNAGHPEGWPGGPRLNRRKAKLKSKKKRGGGNGLQTHTRKTRRLLGKPSRGLRGRGPRGAGFEVG